MKVKRGDILKGIDPNTWEDIEYEYLGKETSPILINSGFIIRLKDFNSKNNSIIIVTKDWIKERALEVK